MRYGVELGHRVALVLVEHAQLLRSILTHFDAYSVLIFIRDIENEKEYGDIIL